MIDSRYKRPRKEQSCLYLLELGSLGELVVLLTQEVSLKITAQHGQSNQLEQGRAQVVSWERCQSGRAEDRHDLVNHGHHKQSRGHHTDRESAAVLRVPATEGNGGPEEDQAGAEQSKHGDLTEDQTDLGLVGISYIRGQDGATNDTGNHGQEEDASVVDQGLLKESAGFLVVSVAELGQDAVVKASEDQEDKDHTDRHQGRLSNVVVDPGRAGEGVGGWGWGRVRGHESSETISCYTDRAEQGAEEVDPPARTGEAEGELEEEDAEESCGDA